MHIVPLSYHVCTRRIHCYTVSSHSFCVQVDFIEEKHPGLLSLSFVMVGSYLGFGFVIQTMDVQINNWPVCQDTFVGSMSEVRWNLGACSDENKKVPV